LAHTVLGWLNTGGWLVETLISGAIVTIKASAGGLPGLLTTIALSLVGAGISMLATGFGFQLFAIANAFQSQMDRQANMPIQEWCDQYGEGKCGKLPTT
jgi:hypothetical protein